MTIKFRYLSLGCGIRNVCVYIVTLTPIDHYRPTFDTKPHFNDKFNSQFEID